MTDGKSEVPLTVAVCPDPTLVGTECHIRATAPLATVYSVCGVQLLDLLSLIVGAEPSNRIKPTTKSPAPVVLMAVVVKPSPFVLPSAFAAMKENVAP